METYKSLFRALCPIHCLMCDLISQNTQMICEDCYRTLPYSALRCTHCGITTLTENVCDFCATNPNPFDNTYVLFDYKKPITRFITQYKFHENLSLSAFFATEWIYFIEKNTITLPEIIIPMPLHPKRLRARGFNQALEIIKPIGKYFKTPIDTKSCVRIKNTEAQSRLSADKRPHNIKNAFSLSQKMSAKHVAIFDDVMTTGSTVRELCMLLKKEGVKKISVFCCARA